MNIICYFDRGFYVDGVPIGIYNLEFCASKPTEILYCLYNSIVHEIVKLCLW